MPRKLTRRRFVQTVAAGTAAGIGPWSIRNLHAADEIKVASIFDASGGLDVYGRAMVNCMTMAADDLNAAGGVLGRKVKLINYDPQSNIQLYTQFATEAATKEHVAVVHACITSASREAIRPILRRFNTLFFYPTLYEGGVCDRNFFCTGTTPGQTLEKLIPFCMKKWGKRIYTVAADYNFGQISAKWVKKYAQDNGGEVLASEFFPLDVTDFGSTIKKIEAAKPDFVWSTLVGGSHISFYRQWAATGMNKKILIASNTFGLGGEHLVMAPGDCDGFTAAYAYFQEIDTPLNRDFVKRYHARFGESAPLLQELSLMTYHGFNLWAEAVKKANSVDRMKVIEALESHLSYDGPAGKTTIDPATHHAIVDVYIGEVVGHSFKVAEKFAQQPPSDTAAVCNLIKNPNDNQQYVINVKT